MSFPVRYYESGTNNELNDGGIVSLRNVMTSLAGSWAPENPSHKVSYIINIYIYIILYI